MKKNLISRNEKIEKNNNNNITSLSNYALNNLNEK